MSDGDTDRTFTMDWRPGVVDFCAHRDHHPTGDPPVEDEVFCWRYDGPSVPSEGDETFRMNLWAFQSQTDMGYEAEVAARRPRWPGLLEYRLI